MIDLRHFGNVGLEFFGKFSLVDTFIKEYLCWFQQNLDKKKKQPEVWYGMIEKFLESQNPNKETL